MIVRECGEAESGDESADFECESKKVCDGGDKEAPCDAGDEELFLGVCDEFEKDGE